jgi:NitT/TauT family transport system substrate-binding protein
MWIDPKIWKETAQNAKDAGLTSTVIDTDAMLTDEILVAAAPTKR